MASGSDVEMESEAADSEDERGEEFVESTSGEERYSSSDEADMEHFEQMLTSAYSKHGGAHVLDPAERDSLLLYDKDWYEDLDLPGMCRLIPVMQVP